MSDSKRISVSLDESDMAAMVAVMSRMNPRDANGKVRGIDLSDAIREALHHYARHLGWDGRDGTAAKLGMPQ